MVNKRALFAYLFAHLGMFLGAFSIFAFCPTYVGFERATTGHIAYDFVVFVDTRFNAFPSLHAGFAVLGAYCAKVAYASLRLADWYVCVTRVTALLVCVAAVLIRQHVILDIIVGGLIGGIGCLLFQMWIDSDVAISDLRHRDD